MRIEINLTNKSQANEADKFVTYSSKLIKALQQKAKDFNANTNQKIQTSQLKEVFVLGAKAQDTYTSNQCGWARVNLYLRALSEVDKFVHNTKVLAEGFNGQIFDFSAVHKPETQDFAKAQEDIKKFDVEFDFGDVTNLYIDDSKQLSKFYEKYL